MLLTIEFPEESKYSVVIISSNGPKHFPIDSTSQKANDRMTNHSVCSKYQYFQWASWTGDEND